MSAATTKPRGNQDVPPITRLKEIAQAKREVRQELWAWREDPTLTNAAIRGRIETTYGIQLSRDGQLSEFWPWLRHQIRAENWNERMSEFEEWYSKSNPEATTERIRQAGIAFFMTETAADGDRKGFVEVAHLDLKERDGKTKALMDEKKIQIAERRVRVLEQKAAQADQAKAVTESKLTPEEKLAKMRQIFGMS